MDRFVQGEARSQISFLRECFDDYAAVDNPVNFSEAFVDALKLDKLRFTGPSPKQRVVRSVTRR
ncbi:MAG: hypothetical protein ACI9W2_005230 [Gammaproteobacteria bacterium]|jgi:hypothetical protein